MLSRVSTCFSEPHTHSTDSHSTTSPATVIKNNLNSCLHIYGNNKNTKPNFSQNSLNLQTGLVVNEEFPYKLSLSLWN